ncbi:hypothetical protein CCMSSC00406_0007589 [Pleurotus cornucopiae]|uniref:Uncharacterized protein n=1 Tax=Pleurotus cornucopiae TaxID=5321 RepID=A0ACB7IYQ8_PLECO|nr:hypothetical protein CCMSSC00406_0007589 [Pleurotus cornucopiae]
MHGEGDAGPEAADDEAEHEADIPAAEAFVAEDDHGTYTEDSPEDTVEVDDASDPSPSAHNRFENNTEGGRKTRGQIASYAGVMMAMQFRSHLFSVLICGKYTRFIRWDRSCAIVSRRFDYTLYPRILFNFYHRFAQLTDTQRGLLACFKTASDKQASAALQTLKAYAGDAYGPAGGAKYKELLDKRCVPLLHMTYKKDHYVVPAPTFNGGMFSPFGRMTRNRPAVLITKNLANCIVMFFKDYWREHSEHTKTEAGVYNLQVTNAKTKECLYFAKMHAGGDAEVDGRPATTIGYDMRSNTGKLPIRHLTAHSIFLTTIGRNLKMFRSARELVSCMADAMEAHQLAYDELHILHRDISAGNILISTDKPDRGILIDWDHCIFMDNLTEDRTTRVQRTGTWQFMSAHMTANPEGASHGLVDDRESALHVLLYIGIQHLAHNKANAYAMQDLLHVFDGYIEIEGSPYRKGTMSKRYFILSGGMGLDFEIQVMNELIQHLSKSDAEHEAQALDLKSKLHNISEDSQWLYCSLRTFAAYLSKRSPEEVDYIDNTKLLKSNRKDPPRKKQRSSRK